MPTGCPLKRSHPAPPIISEFSQHVSKDLLKTLDVKLTECVFRHVLISTIALPPLQSHQTLLHPWNGTTRTALLLMWSRKHRPVACAPQLYLDPAQNAKRYHPAKHARSNPLPANPMPSAEYQHGPLPQIAQRPFFSYFPN